MSVRLKLSRSERLAWAVTLSLSKRLRLAMPSSVYYSTMTSWPLLPAPAPPLPTKFQTLLSHSTGTSTTALRWAKARPPNRGRSGRNQNPRRRRRPSTLWTSTGWEGSSPGVAASRRTTRSQSLRPWCWAWPRPVMGSYHRAAALRRRLRRGHPRCLAVRLLEWSSRAGAGPAPGRSSDLRRTNYWGWSSAICPGEGALQPCSNTAMASPKLSWHLVPNRLK